LDLIWKDEKVDWPQLLDKDTRGFTKIQVSNIHRKKILEKLSLQDRKKMLALESEILKSLY
jgi:hypothetical protein